MLSSTALAYRRCQLIRINGDEVGVRFIKPVAAKKKGILSSARPLPA